MNCGRAKCHDDRAFYQTKTMQPGQLVAYTGKESSPVVAQLAHDQLRSLTSWRENRLVFDNASMDELAERFLEVYGLELLLRDEAFIGQEFRGELPIDDLDKALLIVAETFAMIPVRQDDRVYFMPK